VVQAEAWVEMSMMLMFPGVVGLPLLLVGNGFRLISLRKFLR